MTSLPELLEWYHSKRRDLPWRRDTDPYRIWISEVMLQQTRVEAVKPYFARFLALFPSVEKLAASELEAVLAAWSGLGYYRRARLLHRAAQKIVEDGGFPPGAKGWRELPGIGDYTGAAIASIAFGEPVAVIDGNVERVLSRLRTLSLDPKRGEGRRAVRRLADELLDRERPGDWNQALMELGATVCTPRAPRCGSCPLAEECLARARGDAERFPLSARAAAPIAVRLIAAIVEDGDRVLLFRRGDDGGLLAGTWEVPWVEAREGAEAPEQLFARAYGGSWTLSQPLAEVRHSVTHYRLTVQVRRAELVAGSHVGEGSEAGWFTPGERKKLPRSSLLAKILKQTAGDTGASEAAIEREHL